MADSTIKETVVTVLEQARYFQPLSRWSEPVVEGAHLGVVRDQLGLDCSLTKLGDALRSLHNAGRIRCARPRNGRDGRRPYALYLPRMAMAHKAI